MSKKKEEQNITGRVTKKALVVSAISLSLSFILLAVTGTMAWFSMNRETDSNGMRTQIEVTPNMIISRDLTTLQNATSSNALDMISVSFSEEGDTVPVLKAVTHGKDSQNQDSSSGLVYVQNPSAIDATTGLVKSGKTLNKVAAVNPEDTNKYYIDYVVYLASLDGSIDYDKLTVTMSPATDGYLTTHKPYSAASIDFYVSTSSDTIGTYAGTLNLAGKTLDGTTAKTSLDLDGDSGTVPVNSGTGSGYIRVTMRCYFDGALVDSATSKAFINTATIALDDGFGFKVNFSAIEPES